MKTITYNSKAEYATDNDGTGVFKLTREGDYKQIAGNEQTPIFKTPAELSRWVKKNFIIGVFADASAEIRASKLRIVKTFNW